MFAATASQFTPQGNRFPFVRTLIANTLGRDATVFGIIIFVVAYRCYARLPLLLAMTMLALLTTLITESRTPLFTLLIALSFQIDMILVYIRRYNDAA